MKSYDDRSAESRELKVYIDNDYNLYKQRYEPMVDNQMKKLGKRIYNPILAEKMWKYLADEGAKKYQKEFGGSNLFSPADRREVAEMLRDDFEDRMRNEGFMRKDGKPTEKAIKHAMTRAQKEKAKRKKKNTMPRSRHFR